MIHPDQRLPRSLGEAPGQHDARKDATNQAGARGHGDTVDLRKTKPCQCEGLLDAAVEAFGMRARGNFRDDPTEGCMKLGLAFHYGRQDRRRSITIQLNHGGGTVVAAGFDAKEGKSCHIRCPLGCCRGNTAGMTPQQQALPILLTRPLAQSQRFADSLTDRFGDRLDVIISPIMQLRFLEPVWPEGEHQMLILTSETGVEAAVRLRLIGKPLPLKAICVGDRTAAVAREAGFAAQSAEGDAEALIAMVLNTNERGPFLHLRGRDARGDIAPRLMAKGLTAHSVIVYEQVSEPLSRAAHRLLVASSPVIVPIFSPRSAALLAEQGPFPAPLWVVAISEAVAVTAERLAPKRIEIARRPDSARMLDAIEKIISTAAS